VPYYQYSHETPEWPWIPNNYIQVKTSSDQLGIALSGVAESSPPTTSVSGPYMTLISVSPTLDPNHFDAIVRYKDKNWSLLEHDVKCQSTVTRSD
jgi:hypothetical protein